MIPWLSFIDLFSKKLVVCLIFQSSSRGFELIDMCCGSDLSSISQLFGGGGEEGHVPESPKSDTLRIIQKNDVG